MRIRALVNAGGIWGEEEKLFFIEEGKEYDLPDDLAKVLIEAGQAEELAATKVVDKPARRKATKEEFEPGNEEE